MSTHFHRINKFVAPTADPYLSKLLLMFGTVALNKLAGAVNSDIYQQVSEWKFSPGMWSFLKKDPYFTLVKKVGMSGYFGFNFDILDFKDQDRKDAYRITTEFAEKFGINAGGIVYWLSSKVQGDNFDVVAEKTKELDIVHLIEYLPCDEMIEIEKQLYTIANKSVEQPTRENRYDY